MIENETVISYNQPTTIYVLHLVITSFLWSAISFSFYLVQFMTKYYEGGLFLNYYLDGSARIVGNIMAQFIYKAVKIRWSFIISLGFTFTMCLLIFLFQESYLPASWISSLGHPESPFPEGS